VQKPKRLLHATLEVSNTNMKAAFGRLFFDTYPLGYKTALDQFNWGKSPVQTVLFDTIIVVFKTSSYTGSMILQRKGVGHGGCS